MGGAGSREQRERRETKVGKDAQRESEITHGIGGSGAGSSTDEEHVLVIAVVLGYKGGLQFGLVLQLGR